MKVQKIRLRPNVYSWIVLGDDHLPIQPIIGFICYLDNTEKSTHTIRAYANHLKLFWEYLLIHDYDWKNIKLDCLAGFVRWLRKYDQNSNVIHLAENLDRKATTINSMLGCISSFYKYHNHLGNTDVTITEASSLPRGRYKSLLYHVFKGKPTQQRIISLKQYKKIPKTISDDKFAILVSLCRNPRDIFLLNLLFDTGLRIGQALLLKHEDIISWDNEIHITPREINENEARNKSQKYNIIQVSTKLMELYAAYVNLTQQHEPSSYVFINLQNRSPLRYSAIRKLFLRLTKQSGFKITPHMLRHTHASSLINFGWDSALVQKRLGHASVQTTLDIYSHIDQTAIKNAYKEYQNRIGAK